MRACRLLLVLVALSWPAFALAQSVAGARAFTLGLYRAYAHRAPDYLGGQRRRVFSPRLLSLIQRDRLLTPPGEVGALDGDPICDCQDPDGLTDVQVAVSGAGPGRAVARVRFRFSSEARAATLDLVAVHGQWRVDDVHTKDTPSLADLLRDAHPDRRRGRHG